MVNPETNSAQGSPRARQGFVVEELSYGAPQVYESSCGRGDPATCSTSRANFRRLHCSVEIDRTRRANVSASSELAQRCQADTYLAVERVGHDASGSIVGNRCGGGAARLAFRLVFEARQEFATESLPGIARECLRPCLPRQAPDCRETDKTLASTQQTTSSSHLSARSTPVSNASRLHLDALADPGEHPST